MKKNNHISALFPRSFLLCIVFLLFMQLITSCGKAPAAYETHEVIMGTIVNQTLYGENAPKAAAEASTKLRELETLLSFQSAASDLNRLNKNAGQGNITLSRETVFLLNKSLYYAKITDGSFNILVGPLVKRWKVTAADADVPTPQEIALLLPLTRYQDLTVDESRLSARLAKKGQMADLGGIAKGYASDAVLEIYRRYGIQSAIVDIGGNIGLIGKSPDGTPWRVGIQSPGKPRGTYVGYLSLSDVSLSTSGAYERYFEKKGRIYHHIIDPRTGYPADAGLLSASIIADKSVDSDALSKVFVMGADKGIALINTLPNTHALLITKDKKIIVTKGIQSRFTLTDTQNYTVECR